MLHHQSSIDILQKKLSADGLAPHVDKLMQCPLGCGYYFKYCKDHFCAETISFVIEVEKFVDLFAVDNEEVWVASKTWRELDEEIALNQMGLGMSSSAIQKSTTELILSGNLISESSWPQTKVNRLAVLSAIQIIWSRFFSADSEDQICVSDAVLQKTCKRLMNISFYGKEVFREVCKDPAVTSSLRDISQRYEQSDDHKICMYRMSQLSKQSSSLSIHIPLPKHSVYGHYTKEVLLRENNPVLFPLSDVLIDGVLYGAFLKYLNKSHASENLRFIRALHIFKEYILSGTKEDMKNADVWAFTMFQNFVLQGSAYELCLSRAVCNEVARSIACPHVDMFKDIEKSSMEALRFLFTSFTQLPEYTELRLKVVASASGGSSTASSMRGSVAGTGNGEGKLNSFQRSRQRNKSKHSQSFTVTANASGGGGSGGGSTHLPPIASSSLSTYVQGLFDEAAVAAAVAENAATQVSTAMMVPKSSAHKVSGESSSSNNNSGGFDNNSFRSLRNNAQRRNSDRKNNPNSSLGTHFLCTGADPGSSDLVVLMEAERGSQSPGGYSCPGVSPSRMGPVKSPQSQHPKSPPTVPPASRPSTGDVNKKSTNEENLHIPYHGGMTSASSAPSAATASSSASSAATAAMGAVSLLPRLAGAAASMLPLLVDAASAAAVAARNGLHSSSASAGQSYAVQR
jgi:hypothetical protein